jgi:hypothetical protein
MQTFELLNRAREYWRTAGLLASSFPLCGAIEQDYQTKTPALRLLVDAPNVGWKNSMLVRCHRSILTSQCSDENLKAVVGLLYTDVMTAVHQAHNRGVTF